MAGITVSGGNKWRKALERLARKVQVRAGVLEGATTTEGQSVAQYAACNEFGTARIPARPFMRSTLTEQRRAWINGFSALLKAGRTPDEALRRVGERMARNIKDKILSNMEPANAASTIARKNKKEAGRAGTLVDTGTLEKSINFEVQA